MRQERDILTLLGLATRAGKVISGFDQVIAAANAGSIKLLIVSTDISSNTLSKLLDLGSSGKADLPDAFSFSSKEALGRAIGKPDRAIVAVTDEGFARRLIEMLSSYEEDKL